MKQYLEIAKITRTQGLRGEMRGVYYCDDPYELEEFERLYFDKGREEVVPEWVRVQKNVIILKLLGIDDIETAQKYINKMLYINRDDVELPEDMWFIQDIIGARVFDADSGREYGRVREILQNAPTDVYLLETETGRELLFPSIPEVLLKVDVEKGEIFIRPLEGLFEEEVRDDKD